MTQYERMQKAILAKLLKARTKPPTVISLCWPVVPMLTVVGVVLVSVFGALDMPNEATFLVAGMFAGAVCSNFGKALQTIRFWPFFQAIYDWRKIEALAASGEQGRGDR